MNWSEEDVARNLPRTARAIQQGIDQRLHHGVQLSVRRPGQPPIDIALGENAPGQPLTTRHLPLWLSTGKPITAAVVMQLVEHGLLDLDAPVAEVIPDFGAAGKAQLTTRHLLTHTAGLRPIVSGWPHKNWDDIIARICQAPLQAGWEAGRQAGYDPARTWFILGEMLQRLTHRPFDRLLRERIFEPLGMMDCWAAIPRHLHQAYGSRIGVTYGLKDGELSPTQGHSMEVCERPSPGGSLRGPMSELVVFYEMLLAGGKTPSRQSLLKPATIREMTRRQREGMRDATFQHQVDFGLGVIVNSNRYGAMTAPYGFGPAASEAAFGHGGAQSSVAFGDPETGLVVAIAANGCPGEELHNDRFRRLLTALAEDLGLD